MVAQLCNWTVWVDLAAWLSGIQQTPFVIHMQQQRLGDHVIKIVILLPFAMIRFIISTLIRRARTRKESPADQIQMLFPVARNARIASTPLVETEPHAWNWNWARGVVPRLCLGCAGNHFLVLQTRARAPRKRFLQRCSSSSLSPTALIISTIVLILCANTSLWRSKQRWLQRKDILRSISCELQAASSSRLMPCHSEW